ncbi:MAG: cohesin domain-containing protein, partial [Armatimonadota bacterium]
MRKTLGLTILGLLLAAIPVFAQGVVSVGNLVAQPGASADVPVYVTGVPQVGGAALTIQVAAPAGAPALQVGDAVKGSVFADPQDAIATDRATPGVIQVVALSVRGGAGPGTLFTIPITVPADAPRGTVYLFKITKIEVVDAANNPVAVSTADGGVSVALLGAGVLSVQSVTGAPGETVNVQVMVSEGVVGLGAASVTLLTPGLVIAGDAVKGTLFTGPSDVISTNRPAPDVAQVVVLTPGTTNGPGSLFSLPVTIPATAKPGQVFPVIIRASELVDGANNPIAVMKEDGSVTVRVVVAATISVGITPARPGEVAMIRVTAGPDVRALGALKAVLDLGVMTAAGDATLAGSLFTGPNDQISTDRSNPNRPQVIVVSPGAVDGPGTLFTIPVQVPADAKPGTVLPIQLVLVEAIDKDNQPILVAVQHGGVLVQAPEMFIRVDPRDVFPGETFMLSVSIGASVAGVGGIATVLNLGGLQAVGEATIKGSLFENAPHTIISTNLADPGRPHVVLVSAGAVNGPGALFLIPVKVPETAVPGTEYLVQLQSLEVIDSNNQVMPLLIAPDSGRIRVLQQVLGTVSVVSVTGVNPGEVVNLRIAADERVIGLAAARFALDLGGMTAAGDATLEGGIFAGIANTQIQTDRSVPGAPQVIIVSPGAANGPGTIFTIPVKVPDAALPGTQFLVKLTVTEAIDAANNPLALLTRDGTVTVGAAPPPIPGLVIIRDASGAPGSTISLNVDIENVTGVGGARVNLNLGGLTAVGEATSTLFAGPNDIVRTDLTNPGAPQVILLTPNTKDAPATLFTIPVQIPATVTEGQKFTVTATVEFIDAANNPMTMNVQPGTVTVVGVPPAGVVKVRDIEVDADSV